MSADEFRQGVYTPYHIPEWYIYDCFYSDSGELVIICAAEIKPAPKIWLLSNPVSPDSRLEFRCNICTAGHTYVYRLSAQELERAHLGRMNTPVNINIQIQTGATQTGQPAKDEILSIRPNSYPSYARQVAMTTMVKNEDNIIRTWVDFHMRLGIQQFVIYDNAGTTESLLSLLAKLVDYILDGKVILISWPYTYRLPISGISGQTTQQNHAIRAFDTADWIGLFDVDEFVNIQRPDIVLGASDSGIARFLDGIARRTPLGKSGIGGLQFKNKFFYNPDDLPVDNGSFLRIPNCANGIKTRGNEKNFVIPKNVWTFAVHLITSGQPYFKINPGLGYFNHYIYLNKSSRGRDQTPWRDSSITRYLPKGEII
jgi:hypothetical protein